MFIARYIKINKTTLLSSKIEPNGAERGIIKYLPSVIINLKEELVLW